MPCEINSDPWTAGFDPTAEPKKPTSERLIYRAKYTTFMLIKQTKMDKCSAGEFIGRFKQ